MIRLWIDRISFINLRSIMVFHKIIVSGFYECILHLHFWSSFQQKFKKINKNKTASKNMIKIWNDDIELIIYGYNAIILCILLNVIIYIINAHIPIVYCVIICFTIFSHIWYLLSFYLHVYCCHDDLFDYNLSTHCSCIVAFYRDHNQFHECCDCVELIELMCDHTVS